MIEESAINIFLDNYTREELREIAKRNNVRVGRNKVDTIKNILRANKKIKLKSDSQEKTILKLKSDFNKAINLYLDKHPNAPYYRNGLLHARNILTELIDVELEDSPEESRFSG